MTLDKRKTLKGNNFIADWKKYRKKRYFCDTFHLIPKQ